MGYTVIIRRAFAASALFFACTLTANAATVSPSALAASPATYDGRHIEVIGTVSALEVKTSHRGNAYDVFSVCDGSCVRVFSWWHPAIAEGQRLTVHGMFRTVTRVGRYTFHNEIEADADSL